MTEPGATTEPGLAPQRTRLAWRRTLLALAVVALLSLRLAVHYGVDTASILAVAAGMLLWLGALHISHRRGAALTTPQQTDGNAAAGAAGPPTATDRTLPLYAAIVLGYAVLGTILVLTHLPD